MRHVDAGRARALFVAAPVARLATVDAGGRPRLVPVTFATDGDRLYSAVDHKPKTTTDLARLRDIEVNPEVTLLADHYDDDWSALWWVRVRGIATIVTERDVHDRALDLLADKYPQYAERRPEGPVIVVALTEWRGWSATAGSAGDGVAPAD